MKKLKWAKQEYDNITIPKELSERVMTEVNRAEEKRKMKEKKSNVAAFRKWAMAAVAVFACVLVVGVNTSEAFAQGLSEVPVIGALAKVLTFREYEEKTEDYVIKVEIPTIEMISEDFADVEDAVNAEILALCEQYAENAKANAVEYREAFMETGGTLEEWLDHDITIKVGYEVKMQTEKYLSLAVKVTESWNSAGAATEIYNLDLETGEQVSFETVMGSTYYEDSFAVEQEVAAAYAEKIQEAFAEKSLEKLADLTGFPVYVGFLDEGVVVETREDFLALDAKNVFSEEISNAVANSDLENLSASRVGFFLGDESGKPNVIYGVLDGVLKISGINY